MISIGFDVGREHDPAALVVLRSDDPPPGSHRPVWRLLEAGNLPLGTSYTDLADEAAGLARDFHDAGYDTCLSVDSTGIGAAVVEMARRKAPHLRIYAITIGAGRALSGHGTCDFVVGKHRLTEIVQVALEQDRFIVDPTADRDTVAELSAQMNRFVAKPGRNPRYRKHEAAGSGHDDLVLALEMAMWLGDAMSDEQAGVPST